MKSFPFENFMDITDFPALRAQFSTQLGLAGDLGSRNLDAWRRIGAANVRLWRQHAEASAHLARALLRCTDPGQAGVVLARQIHPFAERVALWQEHVLDAVGGVQSEAAVLAESYLPAARESAAAVIDELARLPGGAQMRKLIEEAAVAGAPPP
jgi:hypothetical protein